MSDSLSSTNIRDAMLSIVHSTTMNIQKNQPHLIIQLQFSCRHIFTNYVSQPQIAPPDTQLLAIIVHSGCLSPRIARYNSAYCAHFLYENCTTQSKATIFSIMLCKKFKHCDPLNNAAYLGTNFGSIDSPSSFACDSNITPPVIRSAYM